VDPGAPGGSDRRGNRHGQELSCLCPGPSGLFGRLLRPLLRVPRLFGELATARGDGRYGKLLRSLAKVDLLVLDDWGLSRLDEDEREDLLEIMEYRHQRRSTMVASQLPVEAWHEVIGNPTVADAVLDRLVNSAYHISLTGGSMRRKLSGLTQANQVEG